MDNGHFRWLYFTLNLMLGFDIRSINSLITQDDSEFFSKATFYLMNGEGLFGYNGNMQEGF